jgi:hypothetical protein
MVPPGNHALLAGCPSGCGCVGQFILFWLFVITGPGKLLLSYTDSGHCSAWLPLFVLSAAVCLILEYLGFPSQSFPSIAFCAAIVPALLVAALEFLVVGFDSVGATVLLVAVLLLKEDQLGCVHVTGPTAGLVLVAIVFEYHPIEDA